MLSDRAGPRSSRAEAVKTKDDGPSIPRRISDFLIADGSMYCGNCLQKHIGLKWRSQVNMVIATLSVTVYFKLGDGECCACNQTKRVVQAVSRSAPMTSLRLASSSRR